MLQADMGMEFDSTAARVSGGGGRRTEKKVEGQKWHVGVEGEVGEKGKWGKG